MRPVKRNNLGLSLFDDSVINDIFFSFTKYESTKLMPTDILENDHIIIEIEMPGYKKEDISVSVENGYLTIDVKTSSLSEDSDTKGVYYRKERKHVNELTRTFYIGEVKENEITAAYINGILILSYPNSQQKPKDNKKNIQIS